MCGAFKVGGERAYVLVHLLNVFVLLEVPKKWVDKVSDGKLNRRRPSWQNALNYEDQFEHRTKWNEKAQCKIQCAE